MSTLAIEQGGSEYYSRTALDAGAIPGVGSYYTGINYDQAADWLMSNRNIIYIEENGRLLVYQDGVYSDGEILLKQDLLGTFKGLKNSRGKAILAKKDTQEIIDKVRISRAEPISIFNSNLNSAQ